MLGFPHIPDTVQRNKAGFKTSYGPQKYSQSRLDATPKLWQELKQKYE